MIVRSSKQLTIITRFRLRINGAMNAPTLAAYPLVSAEPATLNEYATTLGPWLYVVLFAIIFAETGLVVTPFLPGDSLLFAVGAVAAHPDSPIRLGLIAVLARHRRGAWRCGQLLYRLPPRPRVFSREDSWLLNKKHLKRAHDFYEEYGGITIILARFIPIIRTFAPFVAGIGKMSYRRFAVYNIDGWNRLDPAFLDVGLVVRRTSSRSKELQAGDRRDHRDLGASRSVRVHPSTRSAQAIRDASRLIPIAAD